MKRSETGVPPSLLLSNLSRWRQLASDRRRDTDSRRTCCEAIICASKQRPQWLMAMLKLHKTSMRRRCAINLRI